MYNYTVLYLKNVQSSAERMSDIILYSNTCVVNEVLSFPESQVIGSQIYETPL
jgi:hypothetical protein